MRLSLAATILAQGLASSTVLVSDENNNSNNNNHEGSLLPDESSRNSNTDQFLRKTKSPFGDDWPAMSTKNNQRLIGTDEQRPWNSGMIDTKTGVIASRILQNLQNLQTIVECTPSSSSSTAEAEAETLDVGILACGVGRYCVASSESGLGGLCTDLKEDWETSSSRDTPQSISRRSLQATTVIEDFQYLCDYASYVGYVCDCDFSAYETFGNYTGITRCRSIEVECVTAVSACDVNVTSCVEVAYSVNVTGPGTRDVNLCLAYSRSIIQNICYSGSVIDYGAFTESCVIDFDGVQCNSCLPINTVTGNTTTVCYDFDCTNTASGQSGNRCDSSVTTVQDYLATYGCPPCLICDPSNTGTGAEVTLPDNIVPFYGYNYTCQYAADEALSGFIYGDDCVALSAIAYDTCGCAVSGDSINTTAAPSADDANMTTDAPSAVTTDAPTETPTVLNETDVVYSICDPCDGGVVTNPTGVIAIPGSDDEITCEQLATAGSSGNIPDDLCRSAQIAAIGLCCTESVTEEPPSIDDAEICNPCGEDRAMTIFTGMVSIPTLGVFSCQELLDLGDAGNITGSLCVVASSFVQTPCGCQATVPTVAPSGGPPTSNQPATGSASVPTSSTGAATKTINTAHSLLVGLIVGVGVSLMAHVGFEH
jgi:hypothetical protein